MAIWSSIIIENKRTKMLIINWLCTAGTAGNDVGTVSAATAIVKPEKSQYSI